MERAISSCWRQSQRREAKHISGETLGVNAHQGGRGTEVAHDEGDCFFLRLIAAFRSNCFKAVNAELSPSGRKIGATLLVERSSEDGHTNHYRRSGDAT